MSMIMRDFRRFRCSILMAIVLGMGSCPLRGASIEWGMAQVMGVFEGHGDIDWTFTIGRPFLHMEAKEIGTALLLIADPISTAEFANTFAIADFGDVVSHDYMEAKGEYFAWAKYNNPAEITDYTITIDRTDRVYLAFVSEYPDVPPTYGWMELGQDDAGMLKVYSSAWDLDGNLIAVGAMPEPSSAVLLLMGVALLTIRRSRSVRSSRLQSFRRE